MGRSKGMAGTPKRLLVNPGGGGGGGGACTLATADVPKGLLLVEYVTDIICGPQQGRGAGRSKRLSYSMGRRRADDEIGL